jgi:hypothetical protein
MNRQKISIVGRKRPDPTKLFIETLLDLALMAGLLSAIGFLVSVTGRLVF